MAKGACRLDKQKQLSCFVGSRRGIYFEDMDLAAVFLKCQNDLRPEL